MAPSLPKSPKKKQQGCFGVSWNQFIHSCCTILVAPVTYDQRSAVWFAPLVGEASSVPLTASGGIKSGVPMVTGEKINGDVFLQKRCRNFMNNKRSHSPTKSGPFRSVRIKSFAVPKSMRTMCPDAAINTFSSRDAEKTNKKPQ